MLTYYEQKFWNKFKRENVGAIEILIENQYDLSATKLICSVLDTLAGFFMGRTSSTNIGVGESFEFFLKEYMPVFFIEDLSQLLNQILNRANNKTVKNYAQILWFAFRNSLIHDGSIGLGVSIYRNSNDGILWKSEGVEIMELNILTFYKYFKDALIKYENDLGSKKRIYSNWQRKYHEIILPIVKLDIKRRILDDLQKTGKITSREVAKILNQSQSTALRVLNIMIAKELIIRNGSGKSTYYELRM